MTPTATYPSLFTHKGTPVRLVLKLQDDEDIIVEPLRHRAGALLIEPSLTRGFLELEEEISDQKIHLLSHSGVSVASIHKSAPIVEVQSFVIYPDGSTWEGRVAKGIEGNLIAIIWSDEFALRLKPADARNAFRADHWSSVPTIIAVATKQGRQKGKATTRSSAIAACMWKEHSCPSFAITPRRNSLS